MNPLNNHWIFSAKDGLKRLRFRRRNRDDDPGGPIARPHRIIPNWRTILKSAHVFSLSALLALVSGLATPTFAVDIEIYSDSIDNSGTLKPNILFMLDNSGSMKFVPGTNADGEEVLPNPGEKSRIEYLREAMTDTIEAVGELANIGIGRFTRTGAANNITSNTPIIFPIIPDPSTQIPQRISVPIRQSQDDAMENDSTGEINLTSKALLVVSDFTVDVGSSTYEIGLEPDSNVGDGNTWKYHVKLLSGSTGNLTSWVLDIIESCNVTSSVTPDNTSLKSNLNSGIGWDIDSGFTEGVFEFTLDQTYQSTSVDVQINGIVESEIVGPNCGATGGDTGGGTTGPFDPYTTLTEDGQFKVSFIQQNGNTWTYKAEKVADGSPVDQFALTGPAGTGDTWWKCQNKVPSNIKKGTDPKGIIWSNAGQVSFTLTNNSPSDYPVGYIEAWVAGADGNLIQGENPIIGPLCVNTTSDTKTLELKCTGEGCVGEQSNYQIDLSVEQNVWTYHVGITGNNLVGNWALNNIPASCFSKLENISPNTYTLSENNGNKIVWTIDGNFTGGDFSFKINSEPTIGLNNNSVPVGKAGIRLPDNNNGDPQVKSKWGEDFVGPGYCYEEEVVVSTCPVLADPSKGNEKMTICHIPPGEPENAHTIEISKSAWPAHSRNHGDYVGPCFTDLFNEGTETEGWTCPEISVYQDNVSGSANNPNYKVDICHYTSSETNPFNKNNVSCSAVDTHLGHHEDTIATMTDTGETTCDDEGPEIIDGPCPVVESEKQLVGLRFEYVDIPKGATITNAKIAVKPPVYQGQIGEVDQFVITAEQTADASSFNNTANNISSRIPANGEEVIWNVENTWRKGDSHTYDTPSLTGLVQGLVNQTDWCGGNSMAFIVKDEYGTLRRISSYDGDPDLAPRLEVEFTTTAETEGCINESSFTQISSSENDAEEKRGSTDTGHVTVEGTNGEILEIGASGGKRMVGLRFENVPVSSTDTIVEAQLILRAQADSNANDGSVVNLTITGEAALNSVPFEATSNNLNNRPKLNSTESWDVEEPWQAGKFYQSVDIKSIVEQMVSQTDWDENENSMTFFVTGDDNGTGKRKAVSFDADPSQAATLHIKVNGRLETVTPQDGIPIIIDNMMRPDADGLTPIVDALYESLMYFRGGEVIYGKDREGKKTHLISVPESYTHQLADPENPVDPEFDRSENCNLLVNPFASSCASEKIKVVSGLTPMYNSPIEQLGDCKSNNYIVLLTDGEATVNQSAANNGLIKTLFDAEFNEGIAGNNKCNTFGDFVESNDEECGIALAKFLHEKNDVVTHTVSFGLVEGTDGHDYLDEMAKAGGSEGAYTINTSDPSTVKDDMKNIFVKIIIDATKGTSSFAPAGISVSRFNRMRHDNYVYYALFENAKTRSWLGNIKKFEFKSVDTTTGQACDEDSAEENCELTIFGKDGEVAVDEQHYLTDTAADWWAGKDDNEKEITSDASKVKSGGAGGQLKDSSADSETSRTVFTYSGNAPTTLEPLSIDNSSFVQTTIDWIKGEGDPNPNRSWLMAESLHSSPTAITYVGADETKVPKVVVGTNDGLLRMIDAETGTEDWAFLPPELFHIQADLMDETALLDEDPLLRQHIYGIDATPTVWVTESTETIRLFVGMRRGGANYYGLDVSHPDTQLPKLMWVIDGKDSPTDTTYDLGFANLGQTWSTPKPVRVHKNYCKAIVEGDELLDGNACVVLLFGGGYDPDQDELQDTDGDDILDALTNYRDDSNNLGNAIYMVHARTGRLLWWASSEASGPDDLNLAEMTYPIPSDLTVLDTDGEGTADRVYAADVGGQLWRIELRGKGLVSGTYTDLSRGDRLADLVSDASAAEHRRQFFYPPAWLHTESGDVVALTSGSRVYPKTIRNVQNRVYVIPDAGIWVDNAGKEELATKFVESDMTQIAAVEGDDTINPDGTGWFMDLPEDGEKGLARPLVLDKPTLANPHRTVLLFTTYAPAPPPDPNNPGCGFDPGTSRLYAVDLADGAPAFNRPDDGEEFDPDTEGESLSDRSIKVGKGLNSDASLLYTEDDILVLVGKNLSQVGDRPPPEEVFWLETD